MPRSFSASGSVAARWLPLSATLCTGRTARGGLDGGGVGSFFCAPICSSPPGADPHSAASPVAAAAAAAAAVVAAATAAAIAAATAAPVGDEEALSG